MKKLHYGFSLLEMAIALVILGIFFNMILMMTSAKLDQENLQDTDKTLEQIKEALIGFALIHNRLPCPASNSGVGTENSTSCNVLGYLPWADLGIGRYDAWGNPFRYRSDRNYNDATIPQNMNTRTSPTLTVKDKSGNNWTTLESENGNRIRIVAIIFSYGKNGMAASENDDNIIDANDPSYEKYKRDDFIDNVFDDRVTWLSKYVLMNRLIASGKWEY